MGGEPKGTVVLRCVGVEARRRGKSRSSGNSGRRGERDDGEKGERQEKRGSRGENLRWVDEARVRGREGGNVGWRRRKKARGTGSLIGGAKTVEGRGGNRRGLWEPERLTRQMLGGVKDKRRGSAAQRTRGTRTRRASDGKSKENSTVDEIHTSLDLGDLAGGRARQGKQRMEWAHTAASSSTSEQRAASNQQQQQCSRQGGNGWQQEGEGAIETLRGVVMLRMISSPRSEAASMAERR